jgi:3-oxoacyl-[acyl-carrier-protein] synthase-3
MTTTNGITGSTNGNGVAFTNNGHNGHSSNNGTNGGVNGSTNGSTNGNLNGNGHLPNAQKRVTGLLRNVGQRLVPARYAHIVGWGMEVPRTVISNADLEGVIDTTDEWIRTRTGIHERRFASERETTTSLGFEAARKALEVADILPIDIDLIVVATSTPEDFYPSTASKIQNLLGATKSGAFDLSAACSGFVYALNMAAQAIRSGSINVALVIGSETNSRILDWSDRGTCILFGDGAGAIVLTGSDNPGGILSCVLGSDGSGADLLGVPTVGNANLAEGKMLHKIHMKGSEVFRFATHIINEAIREAVQKAGITLDDIALVVPHQANQRIISAAARSLNIPESLFYSNIHKYGNTSAASIPIALCEAIKDARLKEDDHLVFVGFGGGLTWAAMVIQWQTVGHKKSVGLGITINRARREAFFVYAFWRDRFMRNYRKIETKILGPATGQRSKRKKEKTKTPTATKE